MQQNKVLRIELVGISQLEWDDQHFTMATDLLGK